MFGVQFHADDQIIRPLESQQLLAAIAAVPSIASVKEDPGAEFSAAEWRVPQPTELQRDKSRRDEQNEDSLDAPSRAVEIWDVAGVTFPCSSTCRMILSESYS